MKKALVVFGLLLVWWSSSDAHYRPYGSVRVSFGVFYSSLSPHGEWIVIEPSVYAWRPIGVAHGWRPYTVGRWAWTDDGWYWLSSEPWAWAAYHYGRWYYDDYYGWMWIPGYDWAPAWVEWRYGGNYVGWAPLGPYAIFSISFGIHYATHWVTPHYYWTFVDCRYVTSPRVHRHIYRTKHNTRYIGRTRSAGSVRHRGGRIVTRGPALEYVERRGKVKVIRGDIVDVNDRSQERIVHTGNKDRIEVYRPKIERHSKEVLAERPENVIESKRAIALDTKRTDVRSNERAQETQRVLRRAESRERKTYKPRSQTDRSKDRQASVDRGQNSKRQSKHSVRRERNVERPQEKVERKTESRSYKRSSKQSERQVQSRPSVKERRIERPKFRSSKPERIVRRSESRPQTRRSDSAPKRERRHK